MKSLAAQPPAVPAPLDPGFDPVFLFNRNYLRGVRLSGRGVPLVLGLERESGLVSRFETRVNPAADASTILYVERIVKFLLSSRGGWKLHVGGPPTVIEIIRRTYSPRGARKFDCAMMALAYGRKFEVVQTAADKVPAATDMEVAAGGHLKGCRIGFDLGASDYKVSAVIDGEAVFTEETPWDPKNQSHPDYHYHHISAALHRAAAHLPRVDAIGGSTAGIIVDNEIRVASLLRSIPKKLFPTAAAVFKRIAGEWKVPLVVMNDGDVTALAGALSLGRKGMLGLAMGSSEAAGFMDKRGRILGWLNELAFAPVDYNPMAPADERAAAIYQTIGVYLGYTIPHYLDFYDFGDMLILGRVTTGTGGDIVLEKAREVLQREFPDLAGKIIMHVPDEKSRRVGQAVAAASLPKPAKNCR